jgi:hypothetical protein
MMAFGKYHGALKAFQNFNIESGGFTPYLDARGPDGLDGNFTHE